MVYILWFYYNNTIHIVLKKFIFKFFIKKLFLFLIRFEFNLVYMMKIKFTISFYKIKIKKILKKNYPNKFLVLYFLKNLFKNNL